MIYLDLLLGLLSSCPLLVSKFINTKFILANTMLIRLLYICYAITNYNNYINIFYILLKVILEPTVRPTQTNVVPTLVKMEAYAKTWSTATVVVVPLVSKVCCISAAVCLQFSVVVSCLFTFLILGPLCQNIVKDDCGILNNPCVHGRCRGGPNSYQCDCHPGYAGYRCDRPINGMFSAVCLQFCLPVVCLFVYIFWSTEFVYINFRVPGQSMSEPGDLCRSSRRLRVSVFAWNLGQKLRT